MQSTQFTLLRVSGLGRETRVGEGASVSWGKVGVCDLAGRGTPPPQDVH